MSYDVFAATYENTYAGPRERHEDKLLRELLEQKGLLQGKVLDVGCGDGLLLDLAGDAFGEYIGLDISEGMIDLFKTKHPGVRSVCGSMEDLDFLHEGHFDAVMCTFGGFSYVMDPRAALRGFYRVLHEEGKVFLMVLAPRWGLGQNKKSECNGVLEPRLLYTPELLLGLFHEAGFVDVVVEPFVVGLDWLPRWLWWLEPFLVRWFPRCPLYYNVTATRK